MIIENNITHPINSNPNDRDAIVKRVEIGRKLEDAVQPSLNKVLAPLRLEAQRNTNMGYGVDWLSLPYLIECKNLSLDNYITVPWVRKHIIERFITSDPTHEKVWILVISNVTSPNPYVKALLRAYRVQVIEIGFQLLHDSQQATAQQRILEGLYSTECCYNVLFGSLMHIELSDLGDYEENLAEQHILELTMSSSD